MYLYLKQFNKREIEYNEIIEKLKYENKQIKEDYDVVYIINIFQKSNNKCF